MIHYDQSTRRRFLQCAAAATAASLAGVRITSLPAAVSAAEDSPAKRQLPLRLALASYTIRNFDLDQTLAMTRSVGLDAICLKSIHLPLDAAPSRSRRRRRRSKQRGFSSTVGASLRWRMSNR